MEEKMYGMTIDPANKNAYSAGPTPDIRQLLKEEPEDGAEIHLLSGEADSVPVIVRTGGRRSSAPPQWRQVHQGPYRKGVPSCILPVFGIPKRFGIITFPYRSSIAIVTVPTKLPPHTQNPVKKIIKNQRM